MNKYKSFIGDVLLGVIWALVLTIVLTDVAKNPPPAYVLLATACAIYPTMVFTYKIKELFVETS